jgi:hypothetical protein
MSEEPRPLWPWIAAVLIGVPALYVLAAPALYFVAMDCPPPYSLWAHDTIMIYRPLYFLMDRCPPLSHVWYRHMDHWP